MRSDGSCFVFLAVQQQLPFLRIGNAQPVHGTKILADCFEAVLGEFAVHHTSILSWCIQVLLYRHGIHTSVARVFRTGHGACEQSMELLFAIGLHLHDSRLL